jgi:Kef-type K+ transport system membrane component KefB
MNGELSVLVVLGIATIGGLYAGKLARLVRLPSIIGYMFLGVVLGVSAFKLFDDTSLEHMSFITEIALGFVAFSIGSELSISSLRRQGFGIISIILGESFAAFFVVFGALYLFTGDLPLALIFGAVAPASAPAGTVAVIHELKAKGSLTRALYAIVGFDDGLAILIFGFADAIARGILEYEAKGTSQGTFHMILVPAEEIMLSLVIGALVGLLFCMIVRRLRGSSEIFIVVFGSILIATGLSVSLNLSLILTNMVVGFMLVNTRREELVRKVMAPVLQFMPLLFILFFCLAGAHLNLRALPHLGIIGVLYILGRSAGKFVGAGVGARIGNVEEKIRKYVFLGILSQAGVAIGLALIVKHQFDQIGSEHATRLGAAVITTITATCIVFEIIGPILTRIALMKAGEVPQGSGVHDLDEEPQR